MGRPTRNEQFSADEVCLVHAVQRCVRRAFLSGVDPVTQKDYSHRQQWIRCRLEALASVFGIDVLTYSVMSNHLHVILRNRPDVVGTWSDHEVALRWLRIFPGCRLEEQLADPTQTAVDQLAANKPRISEVRKRLSDISWFMRALCEPIARMANKEDDCTGRFFEGRFRAQRIVDDAGLLACSVYVDLNPLRAALAATLEQAQVSSAFDRLQAAQGATVPSAAFELVAVSADEAGKRIRKTPADLLKQQRSAHSRGSGRPVRCDSWLAPMKRDREKLASDPEAHAGRTRASNKGFLDVDWDAYFALLHWTSQAKVAASPNQPPEEIAALLSRVGIDPAKWCDLVWNYRRYFGRSTCAGSPKAMSDDAARVGKAFHIGQAAAKACFLANAS